ncbi:hypothetical protein JRQ81_001145 [Phrynocephalus forsythii]|uniref:Beta-microseminoprotein-like n=1 Tax=Phrynocephalus forsythii TaxID=171643 RepID=A0A9Q1B8N9_9SAUR|nr:hypothetical protein JRQ81_001145 [Phrynocephalus forsythii]
MARFGKWQDKVARKVVCVQKKRFLSPPVFCLFQKVLLTLTALCITLSLCHGACILVKNTPTVIDGQVVSPDGCTDQSDGTKHPFGDSWNTANCTRCFCASKGMLCCPRYGLPPVRGGCTARVDPETCSYKLYKITDPTTPCDV